jgi:hypothetical protein
LWQENPSVFDFKLLRKQKRREVNEMEDRKEGGASIWVWVIVIGATALLVAGFIIFLKP